MMISNLDRLICELEEECAGTKREAMCVIIVDCLRELEKQNDENSNSIDMIIKRRDTGRVVDL